MYTFLGTLRSAAQMVCSEISTGIGLINDVCLCVGTLNLTEIVIAQLDIWLIFPPFSGRYNVFHRVLSRN